MVPYIAAVAPHRARRRGRDKNVVVHGASTAFPRHFPGISRGATRVGARELRARDARARGRRHGSIDRAVGDIDGAQTTDGADDWDENYDERSIRSPVERRATMARRARGWDDGEDAGGGTTACGRRWDDDGGGRGVARVRAGGRGADDSEATDARDARGIVVLERGVDGACV